MASDIIVILGPTGAGKSVQAERLAGYLGGVHLSSGELLRRDAKTAEILKTGVLADSTLVNGVVGSAIQEIPLDTAIVLDGYPRIIDEVHWMESALPVWGRLVAHAVLIDVDKNTTMERLKLRGRADDSVEAQHEKWEEYRSETEPVIDYYRRKNMLVTVDGKGTIDEVFMNIRNALR